MSAEMKIVLIGDTNVGKTCIVKRATIGSFDEDSMPTLGASYTSKLIPVDDKEIRLQIWDTAGQERYRGMTPMYYRGAHAALIIYSITDESTFLEVDSWLTSLKDNASQNVMLFLAGNKIDNDDQRQVSPESGQAKATEIGAYFFEVSAKTGNGVEEMFQLIPKLFFEKYGKDKSNEDDKNKTSVDISKKKKKKKGDCC
ncbi:small GTP-binding protein [Tritrichomonas foetus]|uniref:Small GTP-binding protein n=1 Tax=Tritrichomonas foetus TaxID=1144522 RepID=A0A1J4KKD9_9EUKA|nr:small GTP-binding protein [Tritrichomonas foetus]|eukprot:OHT11769.1 small GTP-binding protein [Tritrichomonas foetus]